MNLWNLTRFSFCLVITTECTSSDKRAAETKKCLCSLWILTRLKYLLEWRWNTMSKEGEWYKMRYFFLTLVFSKDCGLLIEWPPKVKPTFRNSAFNFNHTQVQIPGAHPRPMKSESTFLISIPSPSISHHLCDFWCQTKV